MLATGGLVSPVSSMAPVITDSFTRRVSYIRSRRNYMFFILPIRPRAVLAAAFLMCSIPFTTQVVTTRVDFGGLELSRTFNTVVVHVNVQFVKGMEETFHSIQPFVMVACWLIWLHRGHLSLLSLKVSSRRTMILSSSTIPGNTVPANSERLMIRPSSGRITS
jgi:hypothetical protein